MSNKYKILITGASSGLGRALAEKFSLEGHEVLHHKGRKHCDFSKPEKIREIANEAIEFGANMLINNAAIVCPSLRFQNYDNQMILDMINVNLTTPILLTYYLQNSLKKIININSMVGLEIKSPRTLYSATKWGLRGFSNSLKKENVDLNVLDVYPTNIKTTPDRENSMELDYVVNRIYDSFEKNEKELILDGRIM